MATIRASVNLFALLDGDDSGDKRLADFDSQHKDQASALAKKKQAKSAAKPKKKPSPPAPAKSKAPTTNPTPAVATGLRRSYVAASSTARATDRETTTTPTAQPPAGSTNYTALLFGKAYPSARERIFKQRQEEFQKRQAKAAENSGGVPSGDDGKSADAGYGKGKTHGVKVQQGGSGYYNDRAKQQQSAAVKQTPAPAPVEEPAVAPVVLQAPPPPSLYDIEQFLTLNLK